MSTDKRSATKAPTPSEIESLIKATTCSYSGGGFYTVKIELNNGIAESCAFTDKPGQPHTMAANAAKNECIRRLCKRLTLTEVNASSESLGKFKKINERVIRIEYLRLPNSTVTICHVTLDNGFSVRGESACIDPASFNEELGKELAYDQAFGKLEELFAFLQMEMNSNALSYVKPGHFACPEGTYGWALERMKEGVSVTRNAWIGHSVALQNPEADSKMRNAYLYIVGINGDVIPYTASHADQLATDWHVKGKLYCPPEKTK